MRIAASVCLAVFGLAATLTSAQTASSAKKAAKPQMAAPQVLVAATPPMGWNSWNYFAEKVTDKDIRDSADQIVASGMKDAGYIYVNIDDTWEGKRDENGLLHTNDKFPDMKALADYVHSKGLKLGIYSGPGNKTCGGYPASLGHEEQDAKMYADWGIDYLKYDLCSFIPDVMQKQAPNDEAAQMRIMHEAYVKMGNALKATGRPIVFSLCQYGWDSPWEWAPALGGNSWRTTGDIEPHWDSIYTILSQQEGLEKYAGPGHWNDPDMLEVGNGKLNLRENRSHFSMWAMLSAPLLAGNDLPHMKPEIQAILTNKDVIALDQDKLGRQASRVYSDGEVDVWVKHLTGGARAVAVLNAGSDRVSTHPFHLSLAKLGITGPVKGKDLWSGKEIELKDNMPIELKSRDILLVRISGAAK
ncbi:MAG TPA: glycoside hydrolase family 27 protein [Terracidiphilus sp.]|jgi:alpha-galactosidase